jgi:RimJ/RimL family protein N-acetyltransferase
MAETWIATHEKDIRAGEAVHYTNTRKLQGDLIGAIGLEIEAAHRWAEIGYWIGIPF